jgi:hypothetical protein
MEKFFSRVPSMFNIVVFSIHGYFGQEKVLGLPDTGGQVSMLSNSKNMVLRSGFHTLKACLICNRSSTSWTKSGPWKRSFCKGSSSRVCI